MTEGFKVSLHVGFIFWTKRHVYVEVLFRGSEKKVDITMTVLGRNTY